MPKVPTRDERESKPRRFRPRICPHPHAPGCRPTIRRDLERSGRPLPGAREPGQRSSTAARPRFPSAIRARLAAKHRPECRWTKEKRPASRCSLLAHKKSRRRPTLPLGCPSSTIGSKELNFRVRYGIGCGLLDIATGKSWVCVLVASRLWLRSCTAPSSARHPSSGRQLNGCLRSMVKPHDRLVLVSSADRSASTSSLSTSWSTRGL